MTQDFHSLGHEAPPRAGRSRGPTTRTTRAATRMRPRTPWSTSSARRRTTPGPQGLSGLPARRAARASRRPRGVGYARSVLRAALPTVLAGLALVPTASASYGGALLPTGRGGALVYFQWTAGNAYGECSGVLVGPRAVLTAGHCVRTPQFGAIACGRCASATTAPAPSRGRSRGCASIRATTLTSRSGATTSRSSSCRRR